MGLFFSEREVDLCQNVSTIQCVLENPGSTYWNEVPRYSFENSITCFTMSSFVLFFMAEHDDKLLHRLAILLVVLTRRSFTGLVSLIYPFLIILVKVSKCLHKCFLGKCHDPLPLFPLTKHTCVGECQPYIRIFLCNQKRYQIRLLDSLNINL